MWLSSLGGLLKFEKNLDKFIMMKVVNFSMNRERPIAMDIVNSLS
jgi:hypothetical protein